MFRYCCKLFKISRVFGSSFRRYYSTESLLSSSAFSSLEDEILSTGDPKIPMAPILNHWLQRGHDVTHYDLQNFVTRLTFFRRYTHALQVSEWMSDRRKYSLTAGDIAKHINLISKVHGLEQAENFFRGIPQAEVGFKIYAALLRCYAEHKCLEKAEAIMKKIKECRPVHMTVCYNMMLKLYAQLGKHDKLDRLMQEMIEKDLCNGATFTIRLNSYVAVADIEGMEKLLMRMETNPLATVDWYTYTTAANGYLKTGNSEKALATLKKAEHLARGRTTRLAYESLLTMYAAIGNKDEVYRIWDRFNTMKNPPNSNYISMLSSLVKLGDIAGAEKILEEWESKCKHFDKRIPNLMISAYCKWGMLDKAVAYIRRLLDNGEQLDGSTWDRLAGGYRMDNNMEKAVETIMKAITANRPGRRPEPFTLAACLEYVKEKGDLELGLEILKLCREGGHISIAIYDRLVSYFHGEIPDTKAFDLIKVDYQLDEDIELLDGEKAGLQN